MIDASRLKNFAQDARRQLIAEIGVRLDLALNPSSTIAVEHKAAVEKLNDDISSGRKTKESIIDETAYTWFNRIIALRYMDEKGLQNPMAVTPLAGQSLPEMLSIAKSLDFSVFNLTSTQQKEIRNLVLGNKQSANAQEEIYRILFLSVCNEYHKYLPDVFDWIGNYTEMLLPDNLLSENSVVMKVATAISDEDCEDGNIIGWMYQYYISEKKDEVFASKKKIGKDEIPAATQLFTPEWIVRYLVQNSVGRLWLLNNPNSPLKDEMEYYIEPSEPETDFIKISSPEDFKILDPCCGSGHMLTYAFDLLYKIYGECSYTSSEAVESIIKNNLFGIEIDQRAGQLAYLALMMKASEKSRRFLRKDEPKPNICILKNVSFTNEEINTISEWFKGTLPLNFSELMNQFEHADIIGSLITPCFNNISELESTLETNTAGELFDEDVTDLITDTKTVFRQAKYLSNRYNIVITNPPYLSPSKSDNVLKGFAQNEYPRSKTDTGVMFIERNFEFIPANGYVAMITLQSWMFLTRFENFRYEIIRNRTILSMSQIGTRGFDAIGGEVVSTTAYILKGLKKNYSGQYIRLVSGQSELEKSEDLKATILDRTRDNYFEISPEQFEKISKSPFIYWFAPCVYELFDKHPSVSGIKPRIGMVTGNNDRFLRLWNEVSFDKISFQKNLKYKWFPIQKGGDFRRWYGNNDYIVNWENDGYEIKNDNYLNDRVRSHNYNGDTAFEEGISWNAVSSSAFSCRYVPEGFFFADSGPLCQVLDHSEIPFYLAFLQSSVVEYLMKGLSPTLSFHPGYILKLPLIASSKKENNITLFAVQNIRVSKRDWDSFETSWDFFRHPLMITFHSDDYRDGTVDDLLKETQEAIRNGYSKKLEDLYEEYKESVNEDFELLKLNEEKLNKIFIDLYGLQNELKPEEDDSMVSVHKIFDSADEIPESMKGSQYALTKKDVVVSLISYAVGCMFGRYSLDVGGLAYAGGEWDESKYISFKPDNDNVIPVLDGDYFDDDIAEHFYKFLIAAYGQETFQDNLRFIENALEKKIKDYFVKDFFKDHCSTYKNRPIYWMFSSPKGTFNALMYLHRYDRNTVQSMRNDYLLPFRAKLVARREELTGKANDNTGMVSAKEKLAATKQLDKLAQQIKEIDDWEREIVFPQCATPIEINLDDGVKVNHQKLGKVLKPIK